MIICLICGVGMCGCLEKNSEPDTTDKNQIAMKETAMTPTTILDEQERKEREEMKEACEKATRNNEDKNDNGKNISSKDIPMTPSDEIIDTDEIIISDPSKAQKLEEISGIENMGGERILNEISQYGFSDTEGMEAPDGSKVWNLQSGQYSCDIKTDAEGNIYSAMFTDSGDDYHEFFLDCAKIFGNDVVNWVKDNIDKDLSSERGVFVINISEGPGGHTLQINSLEYSDSIVGPQ